MWSTVDVAGALAMVGIYSARVRIMWIVPRGTKPSQRAEIIRARNDAMPRAAPHTRAVGHSSRAYDWTWAAWVKAAERPRDHKSVRVQLSTHPQGSSRCATWP